MAAILEKTPTSGRSVVDLFLPNPENEIQNDFPISTDLSFTAKMALVSPSEDEFDLLVKDLSQKIEAGHGEVIYILGTGENEPEGLSAEELEASEATLASMATTLGAHCVLLRQRAVESGQLAEYLIRKKADEHDFAEVRVAVVGVNSQYREG